MPISDSLKRALVIGIDHYHAAPLKGCLKDAKRIAKLLRHHGDRDESPNFDVELVLSGDDKKVITKEVLIKKMEAHLLNYADSIIIYFAGHGTKTPFGGYLVSQNAEKYNEGLRFNDLLALVSKSPSHQITIILDCCFSGSFGNSLEAKGEVTEIRSGVSILASSMPSGSSYGSNNGGVFTNILVNGLEGQAADILGRISVASLYNQADSLLNSLEQRPMLKAHLSRMTVLRRVEGRIPRVKLRKIVNYFPMEEYVFPLNPSYEPSLPPRDKNNELAFGDLQLYYRNGLVAPIGTDHMYYAAKDSGACGLTENGKFYWNLVNKEVL